MPDVANIVILGAGFAGVRVALRCRKLLPHAQITLVNDTDYHCFHPDLYELVGAYLHEGRPIDFEHISGTVNIPLADIFKNKHIGKVVGKVTGIDLALRAITMADGSRIAYEYLVVALGSETSFFGIPGAPENSHILKDAQDALTIRRDLSALIATKNEPYQIAIAGGGFTGVELAGNLIKFLNNVALQTRKPKPNLYIVELQKNLLGGMSGWLQEQTTKKLQKLGVVLLLDRKIASVEKGQILTEQGRMPFDYLIWTTGIKGPSLFEHMVGVSLGRGSQITVKLDLSVEGNPGVFVAGDSADYIDPATQKAIPKTADTAMQEADAIAQNIKLLIKSKQTKPYIYKAWGVIVPLGKHYAVSNLFGINLTGSLAWWLKRLVNLYYLLSILPFGRAVSLWFDNVTIYFENEL